MPSISFRDYMGTHLGGSPGSTAANKVFKANRDSVEKNWRSKLDSKLDVKELENKYNQVLYDLESSVYGTSVTSKDFVTQLTKRYNELVTQTNYFNKNRTIGSNITIGDARYAELEDAIERTMSKCRTNIEENNRALEVFGRSTEMMEKMLELYETKLANDPSLKNIIESKMDGKSIAQARDAYIKLKNLYFTVANTDDKGKVISYTSNKGETLKGEQMLISTMTVSGSSKSDQKVKMKDLKQCVREFNDLYEALYGHFVLPLSVYGNLFELTGAMLQLGEQINFGSSIQDFAKELDQFLVGSGNTGRGDRRTVSRVSNEKLLEEHYKMKNNKLVINAGERDIEVVYSEDSSKKAFDKKSGKCDVIIHGSKVGLKGKGKDQVFRASYKNWDDHRSLGHTSFLYALERSFNNQEILDYFTMVAQDPANPAINESNRTAIGETAVNNARQLSLLAIFLDVVVGLSQEASKNGAGYANILVINLRNSDASKRKVKIINLSDLMDKFEHYIETNTTGKGISVDGFNPDELSSIALDARMKILKKYVRKKNYKEKETMSNKTYCNLLFSYMRGVQVSVVLDDIESL